MDTAKRPAKEVRPDYTHPIARTGEEQFAAVFRQRSGESAGDIDSATRDISHLPKPDQRDAVEAAYAVYETFCRQAGVRARRG